MCLFYVLRCTEQFVSPLEESCRHRCYPICIYLLVPQYWQYTVSARDLMNNCYCWCNDDNEASVKSQVIYHIFPQKQLHFIYQFWTFLKLGLYTNTDVPVTLPLYNLMVGAQTIQLLNIFISPLLMIHFLMQNIYELFYILIFLSPWKEFNTATFFYYLTWKRNE